MHLDELISELVTAQHGYFRRSDLLDRGFPAGRIQRRLDSGLFYERHRGVYGVANRRQSRFGPVMAAVLACGDDSVASHESAAMLLAVRTSARAVHVTARHQHTHLRQDVIVHRANLLPADVIEIDGIPCTALPRTMLDLAKILPHHSLMRALEQSLINGTFDAVQFDAFLARSKRCRGVRLLREVRGLLDDTPGTTRSDTESKLYHLVRDVGTRPPQRNAIVGGVEVDLYYEDVGLIIELDTRLNHGNPFAMERDHRRDQHHRDLGFHVERITGQQVDNEPGLVLSLITRRWNSLARARGLAA